MGESSTSEGEQATEEHEDIIDNPVTGDRIVFTQRAATTNGDLVEGELIAAPHSPGLPEHVHPNQDESFKVLSGELTFKLGGDVRSLSEGEEITLPRGVAHMW